MALIPNDRWPAQTNAPSADYPHGSARNQSVPGDNTGTPLTKDWINDLWGFLQALLTRGGVAPDGLPDTAQVSQYLEALRKSVTLQDAYDASLAQGSSTILAGPSATSLGIRATGDQIAISQVFAGQAMFFASSSIGGSEAQLIAYDDGSAQAILKGIAREILGLDDASDPAPISVPNGLVIGDGPGRAPQYTYLGTEVFTSDGEWKASDWPGVRAVKVTVVGGGGGGNRGSSGGGMGHGGGGGATAIAWIVSPGATETVTVGTGGSGEHATGSPAPLDGGDSSFGAHAIAGGGKKAAVGQGGAGGSASAGDVLLPGGDGGSAVTGTFSGAGGASSLAPGGQYVTAAIENTGLAGKQYGGGGSGGYGDSSSQAGGSGAGGVAIVEAYA